MFLARILYAYSQTSVKVRYDNKAKKNVKCAFCYRQSVFKNSSKFKLTNKQPIVRLTSSVNKSYETMEIAGGEQL